MTGARLVAVEDSKVTPGLLGFLVVAALAAATWLLVRSMSRHLKKINFAERDRTEVAPPDPSEAGRASPAGEAQDTREQRDAHGGPEAREATRRVAPDDG